MASPARRTGRFRGEFLRPFPPFSFLLRLFLVLALGLGLGLTMTAPATARPGGPAALPVSVPVSLPLPSSAPSSAPSPVPPPASAVAAAAGRHLVRLSPQADPGPMLAQVGAPAAYVFRTVLNGFAATLSDAQVAALSAMPGVERIEADAAVTVGGAGGVSGPAADRAAPSWGLDRIDQRDLPLDTRLRTSHDGAGVTAYIVDTGVDATHPEFGGRVRPGHDVVGDGRTGDCHGHGTHVAGTVGGATYGVAPAVDIVPVRALGCDGGGTWAALTAALDWVAENAVAPAVANISISGPANRIVDDAANALAARGVFVSVAAGNDGAPACGYTPARAAGVLAVGATTREDGAAAYSNSGTCVALLAPGSAIVSAAPGGGVRELSGTSMAAPHATGVAALYKQAAGDQPSDAVRAWLTANATPDRITAPAPPAGTPNLLLYTNGS